MSNTSQEQTAEDLDHHSIVDDALTPSPTPIPPPSPLIATLLDQNEASVVQLLSNPTISDVNVTDSNGWTGLHHAARLGNSSITATLLAHGATVNCLDDPEGQTPLHPCSLQCSRVHCEATPPITPKPQCP